MRDYIGIGPAPCDEDCAQIGQPGFHERNMKECKRFIELIRATLGPEPEGAMLGIKAYQHEFGTYREVVCYYDDENEKAFDYALRCESKAPAKWDTLKDNAREAKHQDALHRFARVVYDSDRY